MMRNIFPAIYFLLLAPVLIHAGSAPDKLVGIHSARVMSQSLPWMAEEAGLFKKYNIDFNLVFISSSSIVTAPSQANNAQMTLTGGIGNVSDYDRDSNDVVLIDEVKNHMTPSLVAGGALQKPEEPKGKRITVSRIDGNTPYFPVPTLRQHRLEPK